MPLKSLSILLLSQALVAHCRPRPVETFDLTPGVICQVRTIGSPTDYTAKAAISKLSDVVVNLSDQVCLFRTVEVEFTALTQGVSSYQYRNSPVDPLNRSFSSQPDLAELSPYQQLRMKQRNPDHSEGLTSWLGTLSITYGFLLWARKWKAENFLPDGEIVCKYETYIFGARLKRQRQVTGSVDNTTDRDGPALLNDTVQNDEGSDHDTSADSSQFSVERRDLNITARPPPTDPWTKEISGAYKLTFSQFRQGYLFVDDLVDVVIGCYVQNVIQVSYHCERLRTVKCRPIFHYLNPAVS